MLATLDPFGMPISPADAADYEAWLSNRPLTEAEQVKLDEWVDEMNRQDCHVCRKPCDEPGGIHYACGDQPPF